MVIGAHHRLADGAAALQAAWDRRILRGLLAEWEHALWRLPGYLRNRLKKPLFSIGEAHGRLGCWRPHQREITLSRHVVDSLRWDDIKEVLLHEMAHQVVHEGLNAAPESDHGPSFRRACRLLGANPAASGTYPTLHARLHRNGKLSEADRVVDRIHKLMALAESGYPNEAKAAMSKAYELISRCHMDRIQRGLDQAYTSIFLGKPRLRHMRETYHLAHLLQNYYFVQGMWIQAWAIEKNKMGRVLEISGARANVQIAEHVHDTVCRYIDAAWADYGRGKGLNRHRKTDFAIGIIGGFATTLEPAGASADGGARLPVRVQDPALNRYMDQRYPQVRSFSRKGPRYDARVLADGTESGRKLVIAKTITHSDGFRNQLLTFTRLS